jgi:hypothetical protein
MPAAAKELDLLATHYQVFWTRDSGHHWKDITPTFRATEIAPVFFLNNSLGWVLLTRRNANTGEVAGFDLAFTRNAGAWKWPVDFHLWQSAVSHGGAAW